MTADNSNFGAYNELVTRLLPYWSFLIVAAGTILIIGPLSGTGVFWGTALLELLSLSALVAYFRFFRATMYCVCPKPQNLETETGREALARTLTIMKRARMHRWLFAGCAIGAWTPVILLWDGSKALEEAMPGGIIALLVTVYHLRETRKFRIIDWYEKRMAEGKFLT